MQEEKIEGGTKIQRRPQQQPQQMHQQQMPQQQMPQQQMPQQQMPQQQMQPPQQMSQQQMSPQQMQQMQMNQIRQSKSTFGSIPFNDNIKYSLLVVLIFIILNSKIIWKQIIRFPFMGGVEPSIVALAVNSILAGLVFYLISKVLTNLK